MWSQFKFDSRVLHVSAIYICPDSGCLHPGRPGVATAARLTSGNISEQAARAYQSVETPLGQVPCSTPDYNRYGNSYETNLNAIREIDLFGGLRRGPSGCPGRWLTIFTTWRNGK